MFNQKGFSKITIIIIVLILIGGAYFVYNSNEKDKYVLSSDQTSTSQSSIQNSIQSKEKQILTAEEMSEELTYEENLKLQGWKTYRNEEYGLEMKIPADWIVFKTNGGISMSNAEPRETDSFFVATSSISAREEVFNLLYDSIKYGFQNGPELFEMSQFVLDGEKGKKLSFSSPIGGGYDIVIIEHENTVFFLQDNSSFAELFPTFKFIK